LRDGVGSHLFRPSRLDVRHIDRFWLRYGFDRDALRRVFANDVLMDTDVACWSSLRTLQLYVSLKLVGTGHVLREVRGVRPTLVFFL
jgi:hypothetical protein